MNELGQCGACGGPLGPMAVSCPKCGQPNPAIGAPKPSSLASLRIAVGVVGTLLVLSLYGMTNSFCGSETKQDSAQMEALKRNCPDLKTWEECATRLRTQQLTQQNAVEVEQKKVLAGATKQAEALWAAYDAKKSPNKAHLVQSLSAVAALAPQGSDGEVFLASAREQYRRRSAPLINPEAVAEGEHAQTLVPSKNAAKCAVWASVWTSDDTLDAAFALGFVEIKCGTQVWNLESLASVCWLYDVRSPRDGIFVWKDPESAAMGTALGHKDLNEAPQAGMQFLGFSSTHAKLVASQSKLNSVGRQEGLVRVIGNAQVSGNPTPEQIDGYVESALCHRHKWSK
jgi:hypothetical protein